MDGVNERFDFTTPVPPVTELGRVHLVAVGGAGMSAVARLLLERGSPSAAPTPPRAPPSRRCATAGPAV